MVVRCLSPFFNTTMSSRQRHAADEQSPVNRSRRHPTTSVGVGRSSSYGMRTLPVELRPNGCSEVSRKGALMLRAYQVLKKCQHPEVVARVKMRNNVNVGSCKSKAAFPTGLKKTPSDRVQTSPRQHAYITAAPSRASIGEHRDADRCPAGRQSE